MNKFKMGTFFLLVILSLGCSGKFWGGAASGVVGTGAGYEYRADREMDRINDALEAGSMDDDEYEIRRDQIKRMSITQ